MHCNALMFDLDGTLVTSLDFVEHSWNRWAAQYGLDIEEVRRFLHGKPAMATLRHFLPDAGEAQLQDIFLTLEDYEATHTEGITALPGAREFLAQLNTLGVPWGIVTSGSFNVASARIACSALPPPPILITSENITWGKPHPQPFLLGASRLGVEPSECIGFEDSIAGLTSVQAAGCQVVEVKTPHSGHHNLRIKPVIEDYRRLRIKALYDHFYLSFH
ncbi:HAD-IA family hydrolase [Rahnella sp. Lac-M11]|jgi:sugar-phosphatase|uniref:HAD-IA family hydrolase n=1 Tax=Rahnella contaminans TaxID=2703882 RepID=A0A6M2B3A4_9GAMM|nr:MULTISPECIES: HAD-IA family hydrolase [Rahnella]MBU9818925.1 HAD-IA family hydrolase [Rahnella sp. BCC 1045]NGX87183.1 HAD-IA family hydrolase [Rahnella contaminans]